MWFLYSLLIFLSDKMFHIVNITYEHPLKCLLIEENRKQVIWWCFFAEVWSFCDCLHKNDLDFKNFLLAFPWRPHGPGHKQMPNHKGVEKYIFHCFGDECFPKLDFEKSTIVTITWCQSVYILVYRDLLASLDFLV